MLSYWRLKDVKSLKGYSRTIALTIQRERERQSFRFGRARFEGLDNRLTELQVSGIIWCVPLLSHVFTVQINRDRRFGGLLLVFQVSQVRQKTSLENLDVAVSGLEPLRTTVAGLNI